MSVYEVWHVDTNQLVGTIDVPRHVDHAPDAKVTIKLDAGKFIDKAGKEFNAIEMQVCRMKKPKPNQHEEYWALETNLPLMHLKRLEGFTPKIVIPTLGEMFAVGRTLQ